jgi:MbtH protein
MTGPAPLAEIGRFHLPMPLHTNRNFKSGARDVSNPFDDQDGALLVLINDQGQHSLWPAAVDIPAGWSVAFQRNRRQACIEYINENWTDMRPRTGTDIRRP